MPSDDVTDEELKYLDIVMDSTVTATYTAWYFEAWERRIKPILRRLLKERDTQRTTIAAQAEEIERLKEFEWLYTDLSE